MAAAQVEISKSSLDSTEIPDVNVAPFSKEGSRKKPGNYGPMSLTTVVGKILEINVEGED